MPDTADSTATEANRLYWETEQSVADIAQQLDISRRALYNAVLPLPVDTSCDVCGSPLVYENRSARSAGQPVCVACAEAAEADAEDQRDTAQTAESAPTAEDAEQSVMVAAAAVAGAVLGAAVTMAVVRRR